MATEKLPDGSTRDVSHSAVQYVCISLGLKVCAIAQLKDLLAYLKTQTDQAGNELSQHVASVQAYRDRYGV